MTTPNPQCTICDIVHGYTCPKCRTQNKDSKMTKYIVEQHTLTNGWTNTWHRLQDGTPMTFDSFEEALDELDEYLYQCDKAFQYGELDDMESRDNYRIVRAA